MSNIPRFISEANGWKPYPQAQYLNANLCFFYSHEHSKLPIRDYSNRQKTEPNYETKTYNFFDECNQRIVKNAIANNISHLVFFTNYQGATEEHRGELVITGLFPIAFFKEMKGRSAVASIDPAFLSIEDSLSIDNSLYKSWSGVELPKNRYGTINPRHLVKTIPHSSDAMAIILDQFTAKKNYIEDYIKEIREYKRKNNPLVK